MPNDNSNPQVLEKLYIGGMGGTRVRDQIREQGWWECSNRSCTNPGRVNQ